MKSVLFVLIVLSVVFSEVVPTWNFDFLAKNPADQNDIKVNPGNPDEIIYASNGGAEIVNWKLMVNYQFPKVEWVRKIEIDSCGNIWFGTMKGLARWSFKDSITQYFPANFFPIDTAYPMWNDTNVLALKFDGTNNRMIIGTSSGVLIYKGDMNKPLSTVIAAECQIFLKDQSVSDLEIDNLGKIWATTLVSVYQESGADWNKYDTSNSVLWRAGLTDLAVSENGNVYCSVFHPFWKKYFVAVYSNTTKTWSVINGIAATRIKVDANDILWFMESDSIGRVTNGVVEKKDKSEFPFLTKGNFESLTLNNAGRGKGNLVILGIDSVMENSATNPIIFTPQKVKIQPLAIILPNYQIQFCQSGNYSVSVLSLSGRAISFANGNFRQGEKINVFSSYYVSSGNYILSIRGKNNVYYTSKIAIAK